MGANTFVSFQVSRGASGAQPSLDLFSVAPTTGFDSELTFICSGTFSGDISVQGSAGGTDWSTLCQFDGGDFGSQNRGLQSPVAIEAVVRFIRIFVGGVIMSDVTISLGGENNCVPAIPGFLAIPDVAVGTAAVDLVDKSLVAYDNNNQLILADATDDTKEVAGILTPGVTAGNNGSFITRGPVFAILTGANFGQPFFLAVGGGLTAVAPTTPGNVQMLVGYALSPTDLYVQIRNWGVV